jgi:hypothetical protein
MSESAGVRQEDLIAPTSDPRRGLTGPAVETGPAQ